MSELLETPEPEALRVDPAKFDPARMSRHVTLAELTLVATGLIAAIEAQGDAQTLSGDGEEAEAGKAMAYSRGYLEVVAKLLRTLTYRDDA